MFAFKPFTLSDLVTVAEVQKLSPECYYLECHGRIFQSLDEIGPDELIQLHFRCLGGKGGFGSLLRSFRIHKSSNQLMMRDLSGRRQADVKEEERLKKWIAKKEERERTKQQKLQEKYERLKKGGVSKHEFSDQQYLRNRDRILDQTEDAVEAGMKALEENTTSDSDFDVYTAAPSTSKQRKRKLHKPDDGPTKKQKVEYAADVIYNYFLEQIISDICDKTLVEYVKRNSVEAQTSHFQDIQNTNAKIGNDQTKNTLDGTKLVEKKTLNFPPMDLKKFESADELEQLGLDHLKHALESRGLKCGGSLQERAARLLSVKGLSESEYPKNIRAKSKTT
ncbi:telomere stability and silencing domain-containing protein [Ditylenchus destructor]|nr:telomere stability and silencing domain-containing protein [Ditylenchus destructor]